MSDLIFLKALRDKLKGGNSRSIHLNALPGRYAARLDLAHLGYINEDLPSKFLDLLFSKASFEFKLSYDKIDLNGITSEEQKKLGLLSKRLNCLFIENEDNYKEHGIKTFGFGYPLIIKRSKQDVSKLIKAPLFIWPLEILKSYKEVNSWSILRNKTRNENGKIVDEEIHSVGLNEVLISFLKSDEGITIPQINEELLEDAIIDKHELMDVCLSVLRSLNAGLESNIREALTQKMAEQIHPIPESAALDSISGNLPWIYFGGVFGLFRTQKESIISDIDILIDRYNDFEFDNLQVEKFSGTSQSAIETDPSQQEILNTLSFEPKKIIQGPPGTGKSQSLTALITNALANNLKCLVVCEKKTALDVIKNNLQKENNQLGLLTAVVEDISKDRDGIVNSVRDRIATINEDRYFNNRDYTATTQMVQMAANTLNDQHKALDKKIYRGKNWTELVGEYLKSQRHEAFDLLKDKLDYKDFDFSEESEELAYTVELLKKAQKHYKEIQTLDHPLRILNDAVVKESNIVATQLKVEKGVNKIKNEIPELLEVIKAYVKEIQLWEKQKFENYSDQIKKEINDWIPYLKAEKIDTSSIPDVFRIEVFIETQIQRLISLSSDIKGSVRNYENWLREHYNEYFNAIKTKTEEYLLFVRKSCSQYSQSFLNYTWFARFKVNALSIASRKYKNIKASQTAMIDQIPSIIEVFEGNKYFDHSFMLNLKPETLQVYVQNIEQLNSGAVEWYQTTDVEIERYIHSVSQKSVHVKYPDFKAIKALEDKAIVINNELTNEFSLFNNPFQFENLHELNEQVTNVLSSLNDTLNSLKAFRTFYLKQTDVKDRIVEKIEKVIDWLRTEQLFEEQISHTDSFAKTLAVLEEIYTNAEVVEANFSDYRDYYTWRSFFIDLNVKHQKLIVALINSECNSWDIAFECWYLNWLLSLNNDKSLPNSDDKILEFVANKEKLRSSQIKSIISNWSGRQYSSLRQLQQNGTSPTTLFNKRGSKGERRNSLRKIISTDFNLFTDFYPVLMLSPTVCSSILPLNEGIFDLIIFDEASQLRLEDTYPALIRGKIKIVSGDSQQMPPSSYFQGGNAILSPSDDEGDEETISIPVENKKTINNSLDLADSESLLVFAENSSYKQSYLKIHYRSQHPALIDFSNHAFYGKRLIPMPAKRVYKPIKYIQVNGIYEDQVNREEARQVVDILFNHIKPFGNGKLPSVGIATFNLYQRNLILEEIIKARQLNPDYDKRIADLGDDLFVKNLENIQGDERDIIIISTTFGRKIDNSFKQNFGPIIQKNGYKLLNVIITRAKYKVFVCSSIPEEYIKNYPTLLLQQKNNGKAVFYAYLAYAKAISEGNIEAAQNILNQLYENCDAKMFNIDYDGIGSESPFEEEVYHRIAEKIGQHRLQQQYKIGGFRIDLVILSENGDMPMIAIECDGAKFHSSNEAYAWDIFRQKQIEQYGFVFYRIWSANWWFSPEKEMKKILEFIHSQDQKRRDNITSVELIYADEDILPIAIKNSNEARVNIDSLVTVKTHEGDILKVKFAKQQGRNSTVEDGIITAYERSPLAIALFGRAKGEICQLGMLEVYYEILKIE